MKIRQMLTPVYFKLG